MYLEELELESGDLVSYYAQAKDNNRETGTRTVTSDIYFVQIRPFRIDFRQGEQGGGEGGGGMEEEGLADLQKQIVAAHLQPRARQRRASRERIQRERSECPPLPGPCS